VSLEDFVECCDGLVFVSRLRVISSADAQSCLHPCFASGIKLASDVGDEENLRRGDAKRLCDCTVTRSNIFGPGCCVEVSTQEFCQIAGRSAGEEQPLGEDTSGRKDSKIDAITLPSLQRSRNIGKDF